MADHDISKASGRAHLIVSSADVSEALALEPIGHAVREAVAALAPGLTFSFDLIAVRSVIRGGDEEENG